MNQLYKPLLGHNQGVFIERWSLDASGLYQAGFTVVANVLHVQKPTQYIRTVVNLFHIHVGAASTCMYTYL